MSRPDTRYVAVGDADVAYQVLGQGPSDRLFFNGLGSNVEMAWLDPDIADFLSRLASLRRLIFLDRRGTGAASSATRFRTALSRTSPGRRRSLNSVALEWEQTNVDAKDPVLLGRWWQQALGWVVVDEAPDVFEIRPAPDQLPGLLFVRVPEAKGVKNRLHLDFRPDDRDLEVDRLLALGAARVDIGQGEQSWVVLADPEGNEFCVLGERMGVVHAPD